MSPRRPHGRDEGHCGLRAQPGLSIAPSPSIVALPDTPGATTILDFLERRFPKVGREVWQRRIEEGKVLDEEHRPITLATPYRPRTRLLYFREVDREPEIPFRETVLYRDDHLLVADKPHFLPVVPAGRYVNQCLVYRLRRATGVETLVPVHRLDRTTAGLVICSLRQDTRALYCDLFVRRRVAKEYLAVAEVPEAPRRREWRVENRLVRGEPPFRERQAPGEVNAVTRIVLRDRRDGRGLFHLFPDTGKKHQLRVHLASLGFPIVGERYYPELLPEAPLDLTRPLQLLAWRLRFRDPVSGEERDLVSHRRLQEWPGPWPSPD